MFDVRGQIGPGEGQPLLRLHVNIVAELEERGREGGSEGGERVLLEGHRESSLFSSLSLSHARERERERV